MAGWRSVKGTALAAASLSLALCGLPAGAVRAAAFCGGAPLWTRAAYTLLHTGILHAAGNAWMLLCLVFYYGASTKMLATAWLIAVSIPGRLCPQPVVGMSGVCFALAGMTSYKVRRKLYWQLWMLAFIASGFLVPGVCATLHLYCYAAGLTIVTIYKGIGKWKEKKSSKYWKRTPHATPQCTPPSTP